MDYAGPMYIRLAQGKKDRQLYEPGTIAYKIGGSVTARDGKDFTILAHGEMVGEALDVAEELAKEGIDVYKRQALYDALVRDAPALEKQEAFYYLLEPLLSGCTLPPAGVEPPPAQNSQIQMRCV